MRSILYILCYTYKPTERQPMIRRPTERRPTIRRPRERRPTERDLLNVDPRNVDLLMYVAYFHEFSAICMIDFHDVYMPMRHRQIKLTCEPVVYNQT